MSDERPGWSKRRDEDEYRLANGRGEFVAAISHWTNACSWYARLGRWNGEFVSLEAAQAECERRYYRWWMPWRAR